MAKKLKKASKKTAKTKAPRRAARKAAAKKPNDIRFIMVVTPGLKDKMKAAARAMTKKSGVHTSMSAWVRQTLTKVLG